MSSAPAQQLRDAISEATIQIPGVTCPLTALLAQSVGYYAVHLSAEGLRASEAAEVDSDDVVKKATSIASKLEIPLMVDPGPLAPQRAARVAAALEAAGAAAIVLSDETPGGVLDSDEATALIESIALRNGSDRPIVVAKTVARRHGSLDEAITRGKAFRAAGAEWIQPEGLKNYQEHERFAKAVNSPLAANMDEHQECHLLTAEELAGIDYAAVIYPLSLLRVALTAIEGLLESLAESGSQHEFLEIMHDDKRLKSLLASAKTAPRSTR